jgi:hypothetical protein
MAIASSSPDRDVSMLDTPGYTDTEDNTRANSVIGEDDPKRRVDAGELRKKMFGKKHESLDEKKVFNKHSCICRQPLISCLGG